MERCADDCDKMVEALTVSLICKRKEEIPDSRDANNTSATPDLLRPEVCRQTACKVKRRIETIPLGFDKTHCKFFLKYTHNTAACGSMRSFACFLLMCWDSTHPGSMKRT